MQQTQTHLLSMDRATAATLIIALVGAGGCVSHEEVSRLASPSGRVEAILVEGNGGATTSFWYDVYLRPTRFGWGRRVHVANLYGAVRSDCAYGVNMSWQGPQRLHVDYLSAQSVDQKEIVASLAGDRVDVLLQDGIQDRRGAPCGGMARAMKQP